MCMVHSDLFTQIHEPETSYMTQTHSINLAKHLACGAAPGVLPALLCTEAGCTEK